MINLPVLDWNVNTITRPGYSSIPLISFLLHSRESNHVHWEVEETFVGPGQISAKLRATCGDEHRGYRWHTGSK